VLFGNVWDATHLQRGGSEIPACLIAVPDAVLVFVGIVEFAIEDLERVPCVEDTGVLVSPPQMTFPREAFCVCKASERACILPPIPC
jgi:hypothetical protein